MKLDWIADTRADRWPQSNSSVDIDLGFISFDIIEPTNDPAAELIAKRNQIREEIFRLLANEVIPRITAKLGVSAAPGDWQIRNKTSIQARAALGKMVSGDIGTQNQMDIHVEYEANNPIDPIAMLYVCRANVASAIADLYIHDIENRLLGTTESSVHTKTSNNDNGILSYDPVDKAPTGSKLH